MMSSFMKEFKEFALRGNALHLAVGFIIGAAFQGIVTSLTDNILSPVLGLFMTQNLDKLQWEFAGVTLKYGAFLTSVINFLIMAFVIFLLMRAINRFFFSKPESPAEPAPQHCPYCYSVIDPKALRCPACTSELTPLETMND